jgi:hypothetical protein
MATATAQQALEARLKSKLGPKGEHWDNYAIAQNVLHEELGYHGEPEQPPYELNEATRDTLIVHARQDAAHALCNTKSMLDINLKISSQLRLLNFLVIITVGLLVAIVVKLYSHLLP